MLDKKAIRQNFNKSSKSYDSASVLQQEVAKRLVERLDYIKHQPKYALDMGSGTGIISKDLLARYPKAYVIALDLAINMAQKSQKVGGWFRKPKVICADAELLPLKSECIDLVVSNLMLNWCNDLTKTLLGFHGVLAPNGLLLFSTFGPDTLKELQQSWQAVDNNPHINNFIDMHDIGDALLQAGFINPVTDMEMMTVTYSNVSQIMQDLKKMGLTNVQMERSKGLMGKKKFNKFLQAYDQFKTPDGLFPATWEVIYGHAWVGEGLKLDNFDKVIPIQIEKP